MAKNKTNIIDKKIFWGKKKRSGEGRVKNGVHLTTSDGEIVTLLTPAGKGAKAAKELKDNKRYTNSGNIVKSEGLTKTQRAFRAGYLQARSDNAKAYKAKRGGKQ